MEEVVTPERIEDNEAALVIPTGDQRAVYVTNVVKRVTLRETATTTTRTKEGRHEAEVEEEGVDWQDDRTHTPAKHLTQAQQPAMTTRKAMRIRSSRISRRLAMALRTLW